jgi:hypothetical protein
MPVVSTRRVPLEYCAQVGRLLKAGAKSESLWHGRCAQPHTPIYIYVYVYICLYIYLARPFPPRTNVARVVSPFPFCNV